MFGSCYPFDDLMIPSHTSQQCHTKPTLPTSDPCSLIVCHPHPLKGIYCLLAIALYDQLALILFPCFIFHSCEAPFISPSPIRLKNVTHLALFRRYMQFNIDYSVDIRNSTLIIRSINAIISPEGCIWKD